MFSFHFQIVSRKEMRPFRLLLRSKKEMKRCGKRIQIHCDYDKDRAITEMEWNTCMGIKKGKWMNSLKKSNCCQDFNIDQNYSSE